MKTYKKVILIQFACLLFFNFGCMLMSHTVKRKYKPSVQKFEQSHNFNIYTKVFVTQPLHGKPKAVGVKKNIMGIPIQKVYLNQNADQWILNCFEKELKRAGFKPVRQKSLRNIDITLEVKQFFMESKLSLFFATLYGVLEVDVKVDIPQEKIFYIKKFVVYDDKLMWRYPDHYYDDRILNVSEKLIPSIVSEVYELLIQNSGATL